MVDWETFLWVLEMNQMVWKCEAQVRISPNVNLNGGVLVVKGFNMSFNRMVYNNIPVMISLLTSLVECEAFVWVFTQLC